MSDHQMITGSQVLALAQLASALEICRVNSVFVGASMAQGCGIAEISFDEKYAFDTDLDPEYVLRVIRENSPAPSLVGTEGRFSASDPQPQNIPKRGAE